MLARLPHEGEPKDTCLPMETPAHHSRYRNCTPCRLGPKGTAASYHERPPVGSCQSVHMAVGFITVAFGKILALQKLVMNFIICNDPQARSCGTALGHTKTDIKSKERPECHIAGPG